MMELFPVPLSPLIRILRRSVSSSNWGIPLNALTLILLILACIGTFGLDQVTQGFLVDLPFVRKFPQPRDERFLESAILEKPRKELFVNLLRYAHVDTRRLNS